MTARRPSSAKRQIAEAADVVLSACGERPSSGSSRDARSAASAARRGSASMAQHGVVGGLSPNDANGSFFSLNVSFSPRRPPSAAAIMKRQARAFNLSVLLDDEDDAATLSYDEATWSAARHPTRSAADAVPPPGTVNVFASLVKPFLLLKGTTDAQRREVLVAWALDIARNCDACVAGWNRDVITKPKQDVEQRLFADSPARSKGMEAIKASYVSPADAAASVTSTAPLAVSHTRRITTVERKAFLHLVTRECNVNGVFFAATIDATTKEATQEGDSTSGYRLSKFDELLLLLRVTLFCASSVATSMSDFDFRRRGSDRRFSLAQGSDLDSTDEDNDDGAPRPLDSVILTASEILLANVTRLGMHESSGAPRLLPDKTVVEDLLRLVQRLSTDSHAMRSFGVMLGLTFHLLHVLDASSSGGEIYSDHLAPIISYIDEQRSFYTMKADGIGMNRELVLMYDRLSDPFYSIVRRLRVLVRVSTDTNSDKTPDAHSRSLELTSPPSNALESSGTAVSVRMTAIHFILERFVAFYSAERTYHKDWVTLFHTEMTSRERLMEYERERFVAFLLHVKHTCPSIAAGRAALSGHVLYRLREDEAQQREALLCTEASKYAFLCRINEARGILSLESDPKKVANRLVPTTRQSVVGDAVDRRAHQLTSQVHSEYGAGGRAPAGGASGASSLVSSRVMPSATSDRIVASSKPQVRDALHAEYSERLRITQEELDRWFILVLQWHMWLESISSHHEEQRTVDGCVGDTRYADRLPNPLVLHAPLFPSPTAVRPRSARNVGTAKALLIAMKSDADAAAAELYAAAEVHALEATERRLRRDVAVEEVTEADVLLVAAYEEEILKPRRVEAAAAALQRKHAAERQGLCDDEVRLRHEIVSLESTALHNESAALWAAWLEITHFGQQAALSKEEASARKSIVFAEEGSLDMLVSLCKMQQFLLRDAFKRAISEAEKVEHERLCAMERIEQRRMQTLLQAVDEAVLDLSAVERTLRFEIDDDRCAQVAQLCFVEQLHRCVHLQEQAARRTLVSQAVAVLRSSAVAFLEHCVATCEQEARAVEAQVDAHSTAVDIMTPHDVDAVDDLPQRLAADALQELERAAFRASLLLELQQKKTLRGTFRYWLFEIAGSGVVCAPGTVEALCTPVRPAAAVAAAIATSSQDTSPVAASRSNVSSCATPVFQTKGYLRPVSAAAAAAMQRGGSASAVRTPVRPFSLADRMTQFNRVWVSDMTKAKCVVGETSESPSAAQGGFF